MLQRGCPCASSGCYSSLRREFSVLLRRLYTISGRVGCSFVRLEGGRQRFAVTMSMSRSVEMFSQGACFNNSVPLFTSCVRCGSGRRLCFFSVGRSGSVKVYCSAVCSVRTLGGECCLLSKADRVTTTCPLIMVGTIDYMGKRLGGRVVFISNGRRASCLSVSCHCMGSGVSAQLFVDNGLAFPHVMCIRARRRVLGPIAIESGSSVGCVNKRVSICGLREGGGRVGFVGGGRDCRLGSSPFWPLIVVV